MSEGEEELEPIIERLMAALGIKGGAGEYAQLLSQSVSSEGMSNAGMDLIVGKLRERAPDPQEFEARYRQLKRRDVRELDRTLHLLQKLSEDRAVLTMLGGGTHGGADRYRPAGQSDPSPGAGAPVGGEPARRLLPHQRSSAAEGLTVSTGGSAGGAGPVLSPASMKQLASLTLTPPSGSVRPSPLGAAGTPRLPSPGGLHGLGAAAAEAIRSAEARESRSFGRDAGAPPVAPRASSALASNGGGFAGADGRERPGRPAPAAAPSLRAPPPGINADAPSAAAPPAASSLPLGSLPLAAQEQALVGELLSALLGIGTTHLVLTDRGRKADAARADGRAGAARGPRAGAAPSAALREVSFDLHPSLGSGVDPALAELVGRLLPLCIQYMRCADFAHAATSQLGRGLVSHALGAAVRELLREYLVLVAQLEEASLDGGLTLQRMWWVCQPAVRTLATLDTLCAAAARAALGGARADGRGGALLAAVHAERARHAGTAHAELLFAHVLEAASEPLFAMLGGWLTYGRLDDPYSEFFVAQNAGLHRSALETELNDRYWQLRFTLRDSQVPPFLKSVAQRVLCAGKYVHVLRECGVALPDLPPPPRGLASHEGEYEAAVSLLHDHVSRRLLSHLLDECALLPVLRSLKHYLLLDQGDFFVHFLDLAEPELLKDVEEIAQGKLSSCLELALRSSTAAADPYRDRLSCKLLPYNLTNQLLRIIHVSASAKAPHAGERGADADVDADAAAAAAAAAAAEPPAASRVPGLDAFTFEFAVAWPLSIVLSRHCLVKYQLLFRHLFHCKHVERQLSGAWLSQQAVKELAVARALFPAYSLRQRMLHLLHNLQYYMVFEVIEPRWHELEPRVRAASSVDEVIARHDDFLDSCLKETMLRDAGLLKLLARLLTICVIFADFTAVVMSSVDAVLAAAELSHQNVRDDSARAPGAGKPAMPQGKRRRMHIAVASSHIRAILAEKDYVNSVLRFEENFSSNLTELIAKLQLQSSKDGMLANLVARLDYNGFFGA